MGSPRRFFEKKMGKANKKIKKLKRSSVEMDFFTSGLSRKGHAILSGKEYNRRKLKKSLDERINEGRI